jgi:DNA modification methylase
LNVRDRINELRRVKAGDLIPNPKNWRVHPPAQADALRGILAEVGYVDALLARETPEGLMLIDGHLRAETTPDSEVPVLVVDVTEAEADKILATFDPLSAMADADAGQLDSLLREVETGSEALAKMLDELAKDAGCEWAKSPEIIEDEVPEPPAVPITQPGDLWLLGEHRLLCGDSTKAYDVATLLEGRVPFIMVTDPPYGVDYDGGEATKKKREKLAGDKTADLYEPAYRLSPCHVSYAWFADSNAAPVYTAATSAGFKPRALLIWNKLKPHYAAASAHYKQKHEPCLYAVRNGSAKFVGDMTTPTVWDIEQPRKNEFHPTQKPVECMARPIRNHGGPEDDVYDPFLGSGTTLIAAEQLGRRCYGIEIEPGYCDVIIQRWETLTSRKAERVEAATAVCNA